MASKQGGKGKQSSPALKWDRMTTDQKSRVLFVARLQNAQEQGDAWLTIVAVLALLNDCDMVASQDSFAQKG